LKPRITYYAVRFRSAAQPDALLGNWVIFLNHWDPQLSAKPGTFLALFRDRLETVESPLFQFRRTFDLILTPRGALILGWATFDAAFRETIEEQADAMVDELKSRLPKSLTLDQAAISVLKEAGRHRPRLRTRLRTLLTKEYIGKLTPALIQEEATRQKLTPTDFVQGKKLVVDEKRPTRLIAMLDEALVRGGFSQQLFEIEHKGPAQ
jgi:hypothetical protein